MKHTKGLAALCAAFIFFSVSAHTQTVSRDSIMTLKQQKEVISISKRVNDNKLKLAKLENMVEKQTLDAENTSAAAQQSAANNSVAAGKLTDDAQDKKLAKDADNTAGEARHNAKQARKAASRLEDLKKDILTLKSKIAADESKLTSMSANNPVSYTHLRAH